MGILNYTAEHNSFRTRLKEYVAREILPQATQWEKEKIVPKAAWRKMGQAGFLGTAVAKDYGGPGLDFLYSVIVSEEMMAAGQTGLAAGLHSDIIVPYIESFGTEAIKKKYLPGCVSGDVITAVAMTEPNAGSDVASIQTTAVDDGEEIILNGTKTFISNGINCDLVVLAAKNPEVENKHNSLSLYVVEDGTPGFTRGRHLEKMGMYSQDTAELFFSDCRIPKGNILGEKGGGFLILMQKLQQERLVSAISNVAAAELLLANAIAFCKTNQTDGRPLSKYQAVKFTLAELATEVKLNRALLDQVIKGHMAGENIIAETMMIKYSSSEMANQLADRVLDLFGEYGMQEQNLFAQHFRDLRITTIFAGTTEVMKTIIAQSLGL
jgi:alkylation response protein AidB-like acyl-CoA dehydrogenase